MKPFDVIKIKKRISNPFKCKHDKISLDNGQYGESSNSNENINKKLNTCTIDESKQNVEKIKSYKRSRSPLIDHRCKRDKSDSEQEDSNASDCEEESARSCISVKTRDNFKLLLDQTLKNKCGRAAAQGNIKSKIKSGISVKYTANLNNINQDSLEHVFKYLNEKDRDSLLFVCKDILENIKNSSTILIRFTLRINRSNFQKYASYIPLHSVPLKNISFDFNGFSNLAGPVGFLTKFKVSVEHLHIKDAKFKNHNDFSKIFVNLKSIKSIRFDNCGIDQLGNEPLSPFPTLKSISFNKCNDNLFKAFRKQNSLTRIEVRNDDWTWNGFPHDIFNEICANCKNLEQIVLIGAGTGSYFDADEFPYKLKKLDTSMITFHWYVGIKTERVNFLSSQIGYLKELKIHQLPNDFDGGRVLKFIFENLKLESFYYKDIPLILNKKKQKVTEISGTEIQIKAAMELINQFPSITSYCLVLSSTDIASDEIEKTVNPSNLLFHQLRKFEVIDNSKYRGLFGVFLGLLKNLINIEVLSLITQDRNINVLLEESLPYMTAIKELYLPSLAPRVKERLITIKNKAPTLQKLSVAEQFVGEARAIFGKNFEISGIRSN